MRITTAFARRIGSNASTAKAADSTKVIPRFPTERSCLSLLYASLITASKHWRGIPMSVADVKHLQQLRATITVPTKC